MSSYFDRMSHQVYKAAQQFESDEAFLAELRAIEEQLHREVLIVTGDREFPDDLREKIVGEFAVHGFYQPKGCLEPTEKTRDYCTAMRMSRVLDRIHSHFHELARRRIVTRFGRFTDSPTQIAVLRDEWEASR